MPADFKETKTSKDEADITDTVNKHTIATTGIDDANGPPKTNEHFDANSGGPISEEHSLPSGRNALIPTDYDHSSEGIKHNNHNFNDIITSDAQNAQ